MEDEQSVLFGRLKNTPGLYQDRITWEWFSAAYVSNRVVHRKTADGRFKGLAVIQSEKSCIVPSSARTGYEIGPVVVDELYRGNGVSDKLLIDARKLLPKGELCFLVATNKGIASAALRTGFIAVQREEWQDRTLCESICSLFVQKPGIDLVQCRFRGTMQRQMFLSESLNTDVPEL